MENIDELTYRGFIFANKDDLELAINEQKKIDYLKDKLDLNNTSMVHQVYDKALENHSFATPIGLSYMTKLREILISKGIPAEDIKPVPLYSTFKRIDMKNIRTFTPKMREELSYKLRFRNAVIVSVILSFVILFMFVLNLTGNNANVLNYKRAVTNEYSAWEQELTEREAIVRAKERELNIER